MQHLPEGADAPGDAELLMASNVVPALDWEVAAVGLMKAFPGLVGMPELTGTEPCFDPVDGLWMVVACLVGGRGLWALRVGAGGLWIEAVCFSRGRDHWVIDNCFCGGRALFVVAAACFDDCALWVVTCFNGGRAGGLAGWGRFVVLGRLAAEGACFGGESGLSVVAPGLDMEGTEVLRDLKTSPGLKDPGEAALTHDKEPGIL